MHFFSVSSAYLEMTQLKEMIVEADEKRFPDNELLQQLVASVTEAERCATVASQLASKKHSTRYICVSVGLLYFF